MADRHTQRFCRRCRRPTLHLWGRGDGWWLFDLGIFVLIFTCGLGFPITWWLWCRSDRGRCTTCGTKN